MISVVFTLEHGGQLFIFFDAIMRPNQVTINLAKLNRHNKKLYLALMRFKKSFD